MQGPRPEEIRGQWQKKQNISLNKLKADPTEVGEVKKRNAIE